MFWNGKTAMDGLSGNVSGTSVGWRAAVTKGAAASGNGTFQSAASRATRNVCTGRSMFLSARPPRSSNVAFSLPATTSRTARETTIPPWGCLRLKSRGHIHIVAIDVIAFYDDIADMKADPENTMAFSSGWSRFASIMACWNSIAAPAAHLRRSRTQPGRRRLSA